MHFDENDFRFLTWDEETGANSLVLSGWVNRTQQNPDCFFEMSEIDQEDGQTVRDVFSEKKGVWIYKNGYRKNQHNGNLVLTITKNQDSLSAKRIITLM